MNVAKGLQLHVLIFSSLLLSRTNISSIFFALIIEGIGTLYLFELGLFQNYRDVTATINISVSIFLMNASEMTGLVKKSCN